MKALKLPFSAPSHSPPVSRRAGRSAARSRGHLLPSEAGRVARESGAQRLLLTHVPLPDGGKWAMEEAAAEYEGPLEIAEPLKTYEV